MIQSSSCPCLKEVYHNFSVHLLWTSHFTHLTYTSSIIANTSAAGKCLYQVSLQLYWRSVKHLQLMVIFGYFQGSLKAYVGEPSADFQDKICIEKQITEQEV